jgi:hypothetical protein
MRVGVVVLVCGLLGLTGCAGGVVSEVSGTSGSQQQAGLAGAKLTGAVHGGQNPISGAHVYLLAAASGASGAGAAAYGGNGIAASANNASVSLLTSGTLDQSGGATNGDYYVKTGSDGSFAISGDYTCAAGQQVYLYALGGDPGLGTGANAAAGLMAALGSCPSAGTFPSGMYVVVNEVSTVAAAYAMAGFATDATHVGSSGTALALTGIANAFANAANLETLETGVALAVTPAGNGTVPHAEINTLANILASCVNSNGTGLACSTLFANAESGGTTGTAATDTAAAAINTAHNPGAGVAALFGVVTGTPPFTPALTAAPNDFTIALVVPISCPETGGVAIDSAGDAWFATGACAGVAELSSSGAFLSPPPVGWDLFTTRGDLSEGIAVDGSGNAWALANNSEIAANGRTIEISNSGTLLYGTAGFTPGFFFEPMAVAIDRSDNAWTAGDFGVVEYSPTGAALSGAQSYLSSFLIYGIAVDGAGDVWVSQAVNGGNASVAKLSSAGAILSGTNGYTGGGLSNPGPVAVDSSGSAWIVNSADLPATPAVIEISSAGSFLSGPNGYTGSWLQSPYDVAIDGSGNAWIADYSGLIELSNSGNVLFHGSQGPGYGYQHFVAVDGSGDVWGCGGDLFVEFIGVAAPVITPIAAGLPATPTANGSSNLGTRP